MLTRSATTYLLITVLMFWLNPLRATGYQHVAVNIEPEHKQITATITLQFSDDLQNRQQLFYLSSAKLKVNQQTISPDRFDTGRRSYVYTLAAKAGDQYKLQYSIDLPAPDYASAEMPGAFIDDNFLYLDAAIEWYPDFKEPVQTRKLSVTLPDNWHINSNVKAVKHAEGEYRFDTGNHPDKLYLLAGRYHLYEQSHDKTLIQVYLLNQDKQLAETYLSHSAAYISEYSELIGDYPYDKFSIIENHWQTGFAYPSMTLLGSRVIRLPFLLRTSLPHEILHNWWGNGVFVDYSEGNWSEGLTAYLADHREAEKRQSGDDYRLKALSRYSSFAAGDNDIPLSRFAYRHNESSQAIGYSKALMLFHMIRQLSGDELFYQQLSQFWKDYRFKTASFSQLLDYLLAPVNLDKPSFIKQWLYQKGAPVIRIADLTTQTKDNTSNITLTLSKEGHFSPLKIPVRFAFADDHQQTKSVLLQQNTQRFDFEFETLPESVSVDPGYDVLRLLDENEIPPTLGKLMSKDNQWLIYAADSSHADKQAWQQLAQYWSSLFKPIKVISSKEVDDLPDNAFIWLAGREHPLLQKFIPTRSLATELNDEKVNLVTVSQTDKQLIGILDFNGAQKIKTMARRLPHYKSYGKLLFDNETGDNLVKTKAENTLQNPLHRVIQ